MFRWQWVMEKHENIIKQLLAKHEDVWLPTFARTGSSKHTHKVIAHILKKNNPIVFNEFSGEQRSELIKSCMHDVWSQKTMEETNVVFQFATSLQAEFGGDVEIKMDCKGTQYVLMKGDWGQLLPLYLSQLKGLSGDPTCL